MRPFLLSKMLGFSFGSNKFRLGLRVRDAIEFLCFSKTLLVGARDTVLLASVTVTVLPVTWALEISSCRFEDYFGVFSMYLTRGLMQGNLVELLSLVVSLIFGS